MEFANLRSSNGNPLATVVGQQIVSRLQDALTAAWTDLDGNIDQLQELLAELIDRVDAYRVVNLLDQAATEQVAIAG